MINKMSTKPVTRTSQAIRWCKRYEMDISFRNSWREITKSDQVPVDATCRLVCATDPMKFPIVFGSSLIDCVNQSIVHKKESKE